MDSVPLVDSTMCFRERSWYISEYGENRATEAIEFEVMYVCLCDTKRSLYSV
jgi:hypothetical protein